MKKSVLSILFSLLFVVTCSLTLWGGEPAAPQPHCEKCEKLQTKPPKADPACERCMKDGKMAGCASCAKGCQNCPKHQGACSGCAKGMKAEGRPCCEKNQPKQP